MRSLALILLCTGFNIQACFIPPQIAPPEPQPLLCEVGLGDPALVSSIETALFSPVLDDPDRIPTASGVVVGIAKPDGTLRVQAFGFADPLHTIALTEDAVFDVGSIQKNVVWTTMFKLHQEGLFDVDALVADVLNEPMFEDAIFRQLATHNAGLKHWEDTPDFLADAALDPTATFTYDDMLGYLAADGTPFVHPPGSGFHYSNYGPRIAVEAMEQATDMSIEDLIKFGIKIPLDLPNMSFQASGVHPPTLADGFWANGEEHGFADDPADDEAIASAAGSLLFFDACDLVQYGQALFETETILLADTVDDMLATEIDWPDGGTIHAGFTSLIPGTYGHFGASQHGHSSMYMHRVSDGTTFVAMANVAADPAQHFDEATQTTVTLPADDYNSVLAAFLAMYEAP